MKEILEHSNTLNELVDLSRKPTLSDAPEQLGSEIKTAARGVKNIAKGVGKAAKGVGKATKVTASKIKRGAQIQKAKKSVKRGISTGRITQKDIPNLEHSDVLKQVLGDVQEGYLKKRRAYKSGMKQLVAKELKKHDMQRAKLKDKKIKTKKILKGTYTQG